jgi:carbamoyl-phosphate synthase large subunit
MKNKILVCGIAGASLGSEIIKSLIYADHYEVYGCDISPLAYGHWMNGVVKTFVVSHDNYVNSILQFAVENDIKIIIPGGDAPAVLLSEAQAAINDNNITLVSNNQTVVSICSDKKKCNDALQIMKFATPKTFDAERIDEVDFEPCIVKPAVDSGGSVFVFLVKNKQDAKIYCNYLKENGKSPIIQEYIPLDEGEFTIGVLSLQNGEIYSSIAIKRVFYNKLSVSMKSDLGLISSGYSQGFVDDFIDIRHQAENIAKSLGSTGPLNIQARVRNGVIIPFEINPRFSASTYLRTLAGFNEVDIYIRSILGKAIEFKPEIRNGCYLRSFTETYSQPKTNKN